MIRSMTGYGIAGAEENNKTISVEIRSLNSKFLDLSLRLPGGYKDKELELRSELGKACERGKVDVAITIESADQTKKVSVNKEIVRAYLAELKSLEEELKIPPADYLDVIMRFPEVMSAEKNEPDDVQWEKIQIVFREALKSFDLFRDTEGKALEADMLQRIGTIENILKEIEVFEPVRVSALKEKLKMNLEEFISVNNIDRNRFEQELIFYIEKLDISEEKVRLRSHCEFFRNTMKENSCGKKLSFISQEIGREINTIGSKANHAGIQKLVVDMKDELERIKEQLMNVI